MSSNEKDEREYTPVEPTAIVKAQPRRMIKLDLAVTRAYTEQLMDMDGTKAMELIKNQLNVKLALIGDRIIQYLEDLADADAEKNWLLKGVILEHVELLTKCSAQLAKAKAELDKALGLGLLPYVPGEDRPGQSKLTEKSHDDFMREFREAQEKNKQPPATA